jgi:hypothetical protein
MKKERAEQLVKRHQKHQQSKKKHLQALPISGGKEDYCVLCSMPVSTDVGTIHHPITIYTNYEDANRSLSNERRRDQGKPQNWF